MKLEKIIHGGCYVVFEGDKHLLNIHHPLVEACRKYKGICDLVSSSVNIVIENCSPEFEAYIRSNPEELNYLFSPKPPDFFREGKSLEIQ